MNDEGPDILSGLDFGNLFEKIGQCGEEEGGTKNDKTSSSGT
jgi:hypothetical protein